MKNNPVWEFRSNENYSYARIHINDDLLMIIDFNRDKMTLVDKSIDIETLKHIMVHYDEAKKTGKLE